MIQIAKHYTLSPASGFWILEYANRFVGLIALDASGDAVPPPAQIEGDGGAKKAKQAKTKQAETPRTAIIRHFYVDEAFRGARIQDDLLTHAVDYAFSNDPSLVAIQATDSPLASYTREALRKAGFQLDHYTDKVGIFGWKLGVRVMERSEWKKTTKTG
jgi:GNAT superfamily N-acetyltransferase